MPDRQAALHNLKRWRCLPVAERWVFLRLLVMLPIVARAVRLFGLRRVRRVLLALAPRSLTAIERGKEPRVLASLVDLAAQRSIGKPNCLARSLTLWWLLRRRGIDSELRIGVRISGGCLEAHAWVERAGIAVNDTPDVGERFAPFDGLPLPASWTRS